VRVAIVLAAAVLLAGCGEDGGAPSRGVVPDAGAGLEGTYRRVVTAADIARTQRHRREGRAQHRPEPGPGPVTLALALTDGTLRFEDPRAAVTVLQDVSATEDGVLRIGAYQRPEAGSFCGPEVAATAAYRWRLAGDAIVLEATRDPCPDRDAVLSGRWEAG
jgi:hypothetical protein